MAKPRFNDRFVAGTLIGALPLLVWAAHFFIAYLTVKTACALDLQRFTFDGIPLITILLGLLSAAAIGALLWMVALQGGETRRHFDGGGTLAIVHIGRQRPRARRRAVVDPADCAGATVRQFLSVVRGPPLVRCDRSSRR